MTAASVAQSSPLASPLPAICWGQGSNNQLAVPTGSQFIEIAAGYQHTCALDSSRAALCWGSHGRGEDAIAATGGWADLAAGFYATCGLVESPNSTVRCFGFNSKNQTSSLPSGLQFRQFSFRIEFGCGLVSGADVGVLCWGEDSYGRVSAAPTAGNFTRVATGAYHACALRPNATAVCWGNDDSGQIELPAGAQFAQLCCGHQWTCGLDRDTGAPRCWGSQTYPVVVNAPSSASFDSLTCGWLHACGRMANGTVRCWGVWSAGALAVPSGYAFEQISAGYQFTCGLYRPVPSAVAPVVGSLSLNVTASFGDSEPSVDLSAPATSGGSTVAVRSSLNQVHVGNDSISELSWTVSSGGDGSISRSYTAPLGSVANATQIFDFYPNSTSASFSGLEFGVRAGSLKWSLNLTATGATPPTSKTRSENEGQDYITLRYRLSDVSVTQPSLTARDTTDDRLLRVLAAVRDTPSVNMTTYYITLAASSLPSSTGDSALALVEVFDVALVDGALAPISHSIEVVEVDAMSAAYELVLAFPPFTESLFYDPSIGLGVLLGGASEERSGGEKDDNTALIIATAVVIPVALLIVVGVGVVGSLLLYRRRMAARKTLDKRLQAAREDGL